MATPIGRQRSALGSWPDRRPMTAASPGIAATDRSASPVPRPGTRVWRALRRPSAGLLPVGLHGRFRGQQDQGRGGPLEGRDYPAVAVHPRIVGCRRTAGASRSRGRRTPPRNGHAAARDAVGVRARIPAAGAGRGPGRPCASGGPCTAGPSRRSGRRIPRPRPRAETMAVATATPTPMVAAWPRAAVRVRPPR